MHRKFKQIQHKVCTNGVYWATFFQSQYLHKIKLNSRISYEMCICFSYIFFLFTELISHIPHTVTRYHIVLIQTRLSRLTCFPVSHNLGTYIKYTNHKIVFKCVVVVFRNFTYIIVWCLQQSFYIKIFCHGICVQGAFLCIVVVVVVNYWKIDKAAIFSKAIFPLSLSLV